MKPVKYLYTGIYISSAIIGLWIFVLLFNLRCTQIRINNIWMYICILLQTHLYTGLFITAHDAMHGTLYPKSKKVNTIVGAICTFLYAAFWYPKLQKKHHLHHLYVHTPQDPDYYNGSFIHWYLSFMSAYISWKQLVIMSLLFNILTYYFNTISVIVFWVVPALLSTLQLFYFGTWLPHHGEHHNRHQSRSLKKNHLLAFLSCYFFGYHYEHHDQPQLPWWQLYRTKNQSKNIN